MAIDRNLLMLGANLADGVNGTSAGDMNGVMGLNTANPEYRDVDYALPDLSLNLDSLMASNTQSLPSTNPLSREENTRTAIENEIAYLMNSAERGDLKSELKLATAGALGERTSPEESAKDYQQFSDLVDQGPQAIEAFVRESLGANESKETVPEWALPMTVFGLTLSAEPGDWRQAILQARAKTGAMMFKKGQRDQAASAAMNLKIKEKALDIYTTAQANKQLSATDIVGLINDGVTSDSIDKFMRSGKAGDLIMTKDADLDVDKLLERYTPDSIATWQESGKIEDLVKAPTTTTGTTVLDFLKEFTPDSVTLYEEGARGDPSVLVRKPNSSGTGLSVSDMTTLLETYTPASVDAFRASLSAADLVEKEGINMFKMPKVTTDGMQNQQKIAEMVDEDFITNVANLVTPDGKPNFKAKRDMLRHYTTLYKQTIGTASAKISGETVKERLPFGEFTPLQYASRIGLDPNDPDIERIAFVPKLQLPKATPEMLANYNALTDLKGKMGIVRSILNLTPDNVTGITGEFFQSDAARVLADLDLGFKIPQGATLSKIYSQVAEIGLIKEILKEDRFTAEERQMVQDFITGDFAASRYERMQRLNEVDALIERGLMTAEFELDGRRVPETGEITSAEDRLNKLKESILGISGPK